MNTRIKAMYLLSAMLLPSYASSQQLQDSTAELSNGTDHDADGRFGFVGAIWDSYGNDQALASEIATLKSVETGITASAAQSQGSGQIATAIAVVDTVGSENDSVTLRPAAAGLVQIVINKGANALQIFPSSGDDLGSGIDNSATLAAGSAIEFRAYDSTDWWEFNTIPNGILLAANDLSDVSDAATARSNIGAIAALSEDTAPRLAGQLDVNGNALGDGTRELLTFTEDGSAVNHVDIENQAMGSGPIVSAAGDDADIDLNLASKGSGAVKANGNRVLTTADEGTGNGMDADTLDGNHASAFQSDLSDADSLDTAIGGETTGNGNIARVDGTTLTDATLSGTTTLARVLVQRSDYETAAETPRTDGQTMTLADSYRIQKFQLSGATSILALPSTPPTDDTVWTVKLRLTAGSAHTIALPDGMVRMFADIDTPTSSTTLTYPSTSDGRAIIWIGYDSTQGEYSYFESGSDYSPAIPEASVFRDIDIASVLTSDNLTPTDEGDAGISLREWANGVDDALAAGGGDNVSVNASAVTDPNFASTGDISFVNTANTITADINADSIVVGDMADGDWGELSVTANSVTLDDDVVAPAEMADADHGDVAWSGGIAIVESVSGANAVDSDAYVDGSIDNEHLADDAVDSDEIASGAIDFDHLSAGAKFQSIAIGDLGDSATPSVLTAEETTNKLISNYQASGADHVFTMPAAHAGGSVIFVVGDEFQIDIEPNTSDAFYLNGNAMSTDEHIQNTSDTLGDTIAGVSVNINGAYAWMFKSDNANWVEETP